jgi:hypothetical protein
MVSSIHAEIGKIASFLGIAGTPELLAQAAERSSADKMRKLEQAQSHLSGLTKDSRKDLPFVRAAGSGGWKASLPATSVAEIETAWGSLMRYLGYELSAVRGQESAMSEFMEPLLNSSPR